MSAHLVAVPSSKSLQEFLQDVFLCSPEVATRIAQRAIERRYPIKAIILKQGDRPEMTFLLIAGRAHALVYGPDGQVMLLHEFLPGDFFGALANANPEPSESDVVAIEELRTAVFRALDFLQLAEQYGCVGLTVSRMLLKQLRSTSARMAARTILSATGRVYAELLRLADLGDGRSLRPAPILANLAITVHTTRETVSRAINSLERRGIITRDGDELVIVAPHRLKELVV
jgi:CRP/FNR family transcriptional regulator, cyclic AMP receptor protein